jgi:hypothetical protein
MEIRNKIAKQILNLMYLSFPGMLFYAPFHTGDYFYFRFLRGAILSFCTCFFFFTVGGDEYYTDSREIYPKIFLGIAIFFFISLFGFRLPRMIWNIIDYVAGGFLLFYFFERKWYHKKYMKK